MTPCKYIHSSTGNRCNNNNTDEHGVCSRHRKVHVLLENGKCIFRGCTENATPELHHLCQTCYDKARAKREKRVAQEREEREDEYGQYCNYYDYDDRDREYFLRYECHRPTKPFQEVIIDTMMRIYYGTHFYFSSTQGKRKWSESLAFEIFPEETGYRPKKEDFIRALEWVENEVDQEFLPVPTIEFEKAE